MSSLAGFKYDTDIGIRINTQQTRTWLVTGHSLQPELEVYKKRSIQTTYKTWYSNVRKEANLDLYQVTSQTGQMHKEKAVNATKEGPKLVPYNKQDKGQEPQPWDKNRSTMCLTLLLGDKMYSRKTLM